MLDLCRASSLLSTLLCSLICILKCHLVFPLYRRPQEEMIRQTAWVDEQVIACQSLWCLMFATVLHNWLALMIFSKARKETKLKKQSCPKSGWCLAVSDVLSAVKKKTPALRDSLLIQPLMAWLVSPPSITSAGTGSLIIFYIFSFFLHSLHNVKVVTCKLMRWKLLGYWACTYLMCTKFKSRDLHVAKVVPQEWVRAGMTHPWALCRPSDMTACYMRPVVMEATLDGRPQVNKI